MIGGLFGRLLAMMCGVAAASTGMALLLQERSLSHDLEQAAERRLDNAAAAASRLLEGHLTSMTERWRAVSHTPQLRATLEVDDAPTLAHYAGTLRAQHGAERIAFVDVDGLVVAGAGPDELDAVALSVEASGLVARGGRAHAVVNTELAGAGRLVAVEALAEPTLAEWSELCGAEVSFAAPDAPRSGELQRVVRSLDGLEMRVASSLRAEREAMAHSRQSLALAAALGMAVALGVSLLASRSLVRPIREVSAAAARIGAGDLTARVTTDRADEIGDVARAFEDMTRELGATLRRVAEAADRVEATAGGITRGTRQLVDVTREQQRSNEQAVVTLEELQQRVQNIGKTAGASAHSLDLAVDGSTASFRELAESGEELKQNASRLSLQVQEIAQSLARTSESAAQVAADAEDLLPAAEATARGVSEMAGSARAVSENAEETARLSSAVVETAEKGRRVVRDAVEGMEATRQTIEDSERVIQSLSRSAEKIGAILGVIDDVTDETSLLALNAAIIAAQAGESGKAFSVVAGQMKALSERVQAGTREIEDVVKTVQAESGHAVDSILRGSSRAREGAALIQQAEDALVEITRAARESGDRMGESASAAAEQMTAAASVSEQMEALREGVSRIRAATRQQAADNEVVQRRSDALREETQGVRDTVDVQTRGSARIGHSIEAVQRAVRGITQGLEQEGAASREVAEVVRRSRDFTRSHEESAAAMAEAACELERQAEALRAALRPFRT
jgi:methyl-accepting chemotaxis protein